MGPSTYFRSDSTRWARAAPRPKRDRESLGWGLPEAGKGLKVSGLLLFVA